jgi:aspartate/methionine/tyrosine aminotransferase
MEFARTEAYRSPYSLTSSGMPAADPAVFGSSMPIDLAWGGKEALPELEERLSRHLGIDRSRVIVTIGASSAIHLAALTLFRPGTRVAAETPSYEPLRALPPYLGAELALVERRPEYGWRVDPAAVAKALAGAREGYVFITNPNNPTGARSSEAEIVELAELAARAGGALISAEVYMEYELDPKRRTLACRLAPNTISIGSLTKAYGLGAVRMGWVALGEGLAAERARFVDVSYLNYVDPPTVSMRLAARAFDLLDRLREPIRHMEAAQKPILRRWLAETPGVEGSAPELGLTAFPRIVGVDDTRAFARHLVERHGVDVVPGEFFGRAGHLRIGCGLPPADLTEALTRVAAGCKTFRAS